MEGQNHADRCAGRPARRRLELVPRTASMAEPTPHAHSQQEAELVDFLMRSGPFRERLAVRQQAALPGVPAQQQPT